MEGPWLEHSLGWDWGQACDCGNSHGCMAVRSLGSCCSSVWVSTNHGHCCLSWTTPWSPKPILFLDWVFSQVLATRDSVLSCGMEWVFAEVWIEECSEVEATRTHLSPPCLVTSQYLHTHSSWVESKHFYLSQWFSKQPRGLVSHAQVPRTGTPSLWLNPLTLHCPPVQSPFSS